MPMAMTARTIAILRSIKLSFYGRTGVLGCFPTRRASPRALVGLPIMWGPVICLFARDCHGCLSVAAINFGDTALAIGNPRAAMPDAQIPRPGSSPMEGDIDGAVPRPSGFVGQNAWSSRWVSLGSLPPPSDSLLVTQNG